MSYRQAHYKISQIGNTTPDAYLKDLRILESFLEAMQRNDPEGRYTIWKRDTVSYDISGAPLPGEELKGYFVGWGFTKHFQSHSWKFKGSK